MTKDSSYIQKYVFEKDPIPTPIKNKDPQKENKQTIAISNSEKPNRQKQVARTT